MRAEPLTPHPALLALRRYQKLMIVPDGNSDLRLPSALDFFDVKRWIAKMSLEKEKESKTFKTDWVEMFSEGQARA